MTMFRKLMITLAITLVMSLFVPVVSFASVSATMLDYQSSTTTTPATTAEHTTVIETVGKVSELQSEAGHQTRTLLGLSRLLLAPKTKALYHYTSDGAADSILKQGLNPGRDGFSYLTNKGKLSPLQAQIELALPANRQLPNALLKIDVDGLGKAGINPVFGPRRVQGNLPGLGAGGGTELLFDQAIPSQFIQRVR